MKLVLMIKARLITSALGGFFKAASESAIVVKKQVEVNLLNYFTALSNNTSARFVVVNIA